MHDAFIRIAEKLNGLVEERLLMQLNMAAVADVEQPEAKVVFNATQASILLDIHRHPEGPNTPARIARRLKLESSRISHQLKGLKQEGWVEECPGVGKLPALRVSQKACAAAQSAYAAKRYLEDQLRKGHAKEFDLLKKIFLPLFEEKVANLTRPRSRRSKSRPDL